MPQVRAGDRFRATRDISTHGIGIPYAPAHTGPSWETVIPEGTILVAPSDSRDDAGATAFVFQPEDLRGLEETLVPEDVRNGRSYFSYYFGFNFSAIGQVLDPLGSPSI